MTEAKRVRIERTLLLLQPGQWAHPTQSNKASNRTLTRSSVLGGLRSCEDLTFHVDGKKVGINYTGRVSAQCECVHVPASTVVN
jgi:hypothetical protein